jgi:hypothetical protein
MKINQLIVLSFLSFSSLSIDVLAQNVQAIKQSDLRGQIEKINGNDMIERLADQRISINKSPSVNNLPKAEHIFTRNNLTLISFNGLDYYVKDNRIIGIQGLNISDSVLDQITTKLVLLDSIQFDQSERLNNEYTDPDTDPQKIWYIDRQFKLTLKMLSSTVRDIAAFTKSENPSLAVETNVAKMRLPNIDKTATKSNMQSLMSLAK